MVHLSVVVPALPSGNVMVDVGEFGKFMITPALFSPSMVHRPVSPELRGVFAMIDMFPVLSGHEATSRPASAVVMGCTVISTSWNCVVPSVQVAVSLKE